MTQETTDVLNLHSKQPRPALVCCRGLALWDNLLMKRHLEYGLTDLSQNIMESAATRLDLMKASEVETDIVKPEFFSTEYYMLRIYLVSSFAYGD